MPDHARRILVTGGTGYIGSHIAVELLGCGHDVVLVDNLVNSSADAIGPVESVAGRSLTFVEADVTNRDTMASVLADHDIEAVIHLAALKAVGESVEMPLAYYRNNIGGLIATLQAMDEVGVRCFVFSSSATVYGDPETVPIPENAPLSATNPYGRTKLIAEQILGDLAVSDERWSLLALRYFNPVGAHPSGKIAEAPKGKPNNLMPALMAVARGDAEKVLVYGDDYDTRDGTGIRDYIHVVDLATGHVSAIEHALDTTGIDAFNLGVGDGMSVFELIGAVEAASGRPIPFEVVDRRPGDIAASVADASRARAELGWETRFTVVDACRHAWSSQLG